jgi:hypothetical protein
MSLYQLNKAMRTLTFNLDPAPRQRFMEDAQAFSLGFELTDEERKVFVEKDIGKLYGMGVQPFILLQFAQFVRNKPFNSIEDLIEFQRWYVPQIAPYGNPDYGT